MAYNGLSTITLEQILEDVSFALVEPVVNTSLGTAVVILGVNTVSPASMAGIYVGALLLVDFGTSEQEQIQVTAVTTTTFTATFVNAHLSTASVTGATFPSGTQLGNPLFTQDEIIGYFADVQNDFLLKTRCIFEVTGSTVEPIPPENIQIVNNNRFYAQPSQAIRVERVSVGILGSGAPQQELLADDPFNEVNQDPYVSPNWDFGTFPFAISGGFAVETLPAVESIQQCTGFWAGSNTWGPNQYVSIQIEAFPGDDGASFADLLFRVQPGLAIFYDINVFLNGPQSGPSLEGLFFKAIYTDSLGQPHPAGSLTPPNPDGTWGPYPFVPGAVWLVSIVGNQFSVYYNGELLWQDTDNNISGSGFVGFDSFLVTQVQADMKFSNFKAGIIAPGEGFTDLYETTQTDLDLDNFGWSANTGVPKRWFRDQVDTAQFGVDPSPTAGGSLRLYYSKRGLTGDVGNFNLASTLLIPDVMSHYIKYGILAKCWSKDGETRDPMRAEYCKKRFEFGVMLVQRFMEGIGLNTGATPQSFSPMAVPAGSKNG